MKQGNYILSMNKAYLLIGGNIGDRKSQLKHAVDFIQQDCGQIFHLSHIYETAAWGKTDQPSFFNQAVAIETSLSPFKLLEMILNIETRMGRQREEKFGPRLIDIDILFYNSEIINHPLLKVPHPELPGRRFVLAPMMEIAAELIHPLLHKTIKELLEICPDKLQIKKLEN